MKQEKIWDYFQSDKGVNSFSGALPRYKYLASKVDGKRILNIGIGNGGLEEILIAQGFEVYCLDPSENAIEGIRKKLLLGNSAQVGFSQSIPYESAFFDTVVMSEVLEHLDDATLAASLDEVRRVLKHKGTFLGTVPADEDLSVGEVICPCCGEKFHRWGHVQSFSPKHMEELLTKHALSVATVRYKAFPDWTRRSAISLLKSIVRELLGAQGYRFAMPNIFFSARK